MKVFAEFTDVKQHNFILSAQEKGLVGLVRIF